MKTSVQYFKLLFLNTLLTGLMTAICILISFQLGWADTGDHTTDTGMLQIGLIILHIILNYLLITKPKKYGVICFLIVNVFIISLYVAIWVFLKGPIFGYYDN
jgi:hypothetical protein